jgi:4-oxalocrotonate tautomerase
MPIIAITTWPNLDDAKSRELIEQITLTTRNVTGAPLDKIIVYINEIPKNRWGEAGTMGDDPEFATKSRRAS